MGNTKNVKFSYYMLSILPLFWHLFLSLLGFLMKDFCPCFRNICYLDKTLTDTHAAVFSPPSARTHGAKSPSEVSPNSLSWNVFCFLFKFFCCLLCLILYLLESSAYLSHLGNFKNTVDPDSGFWHIKLIFKKENQAALKSWVTQLRGCVVALACACSCFTLQ